MAFRDLSIRAKLLRTTLLASGIALLAASAAFVVYDVISFRAGIARRLGVAADIVGTNSVAALLFEDRAAAARTLAALRAEPHVIGAALYNRHRQLFAGYVAGSGAHPGSVPALAPSGVHYRGRGLVVSQRISFQGSFVGSVVLESDLDELSDRLRRYGLIVALVSLVSLAVALLVTARLQRSISDPILSLASTARAISVDESYSARAIGGGRDETGLLITTFNEMLERIQRREAELVEARVDLERRVAERTADLMRELAERRRTEEELRRHQELLAEAQSIARLGAWEWDLETREIWWSDEVYRLYGVDRSGFRPEFAAIQELVRAEDREPVQRVVEAAIAAGTKFRVDYALVSGIHHRAEGHPVKDDSGKVCRMRGLVQDVTERRRAEEERERLIREQALREEAEAARGRAAFLAQVTGVLGSSLDWERTLSGGARLVVPEHADWSLVEILEPGGSLRRVALAHRDAPEEVLRPLREAVERADSDCPGAAAIRTGKTFLAGAGEGGDDPAFRTLVERLGSGHVVAVPFFVQGAPRGAILWCRRASPYDASELLLAEDVARRTGTAVEHAMLFEEAQQANRLKDEFLATLSHELRTPLHAIVGWAHMLKAGTLDEEKSRRAVESIDRNAQAQNQLISDVLDVSRIVAGKLRLNVRTVDLRGVLEAAVDTVRPAADARGVQLLVDLPDEPELVSADADRLQQVIWNLLTNAIKFVPEKGSVSVSVAGREGRAVLTVADDGPGIRPDFLPYVFERFRQADSSSTRPHGGLGLGLAIVRHLVELHGGTVEARNRSDRSGAVFTVRLPLRAALTVAAPAQPSAALAGGPDSVPAERSLAGLRVLVVDDERDSREMVATALEMEGARVLLAEDAEQGLEILRRERPEVLLSDVEMPAMDGYELLRRVRALPASQGGATPAAALTAYASPEHRVRTLKAGFQMHVPKPVEPAELAAVVASLAGRREAPTAAEPSPAASPARARILVVEDHQDVAEGLQLLLESSGHEVATAADGESALALAPRFRPHLVLLDLGLPGLDGFQVAERLRAMPELPELRLVAVSGYGAPSDREKAREAGFDRHLVKPVDPGALLALVDALAPARSAGTGGPGG